jgi:AhpD family alkylhydroperoxidase
MEPVSAFGVTGLTTATRRINLAIHGQSQQAADVGEERPGGIESILGLRQTALADGAVPKKYKELMAVAVALTTQCVYCIEIHRRQALEAGATDAELTETIHVAAALRAGAAITHGTHLLWSPELGQDSRGAPRWSNAKIAHAGRRSGKHRRYGQIGVRSEDPDRSPVGSVVWQ